MLMVHGKRVMTFAMAVVNFWGALLIQDTMDILGLCLLDKPYSVGVVGWYIINLVRDLFSFLHKKKINEQTVDTDTQRFNKTIKKCLKNDTESWTRLNIMLIKLIIAILGRFFFNIN